MRVGFTGAIKGMNELQKQRVTEILTALQSVVAFDHGDCIGADAEAADIAHSLGIYTVSHPPVLEDRRAFHVSDEEWVPKEYLERDRQIVEACDALIAAPSGMNEYARSGTWYTVRRARDAGRKIWIVFPTGEVKEEY